MKELFKILTKKQISGGEAKRWRYHSDGVDEDTLRHYLIMRICECEYPTGALTNLTWLSNDIANLGGGSCVNVAYQEWYRKAWDKVMPLGIPNLDQMDDYEIAYIYFTQNSISIHEFQKLIKTKASNEEIMKRVNDHHAMAASVVATYGSDIIKAFREQNARQLEKVKKVMQNA